MTKIAKGWLDLAGLESEHYYIEVNHYYGCGWIKAKDEAMPDHYLTTHTFYGSNYKFYEQLLRSCGFNVELVSWD